MPGYHLPKIGVEEEFLLVDADAMVPSTIGGTVADAAQVAGLATVPELTRSQVEVNLPPISTLRELRSKVVDSRRTLSALALAQGTLLVAIGLSPLPLESAARHPVTDTTRYRRLARAHGALADTAVTSGCHVHVEVADLDTALKVGNHIRAWMPTLLALTANSPVHDGVDTGHASWRSILWSRWPTGGPPPHVESVAHYEDLIGHLQRSGSIIDEQALYWDVRPSTHQPTVEIRISDVPAIADETVLLAALIRALVMTATTAIDRSESVALVPQHILESAYYCARRNGLDGSAVDFSGKIVSAREMIGRLIRHTRDALTRSGDFVSVQKSLERLRYSGNGSQRQRVELHRTGNPAELVRCAARWTTADWAAVHAPTRCTPSIDAVKSLGGDHAH